MAKQWVLVLTCEHGGHQIPPAYRSSLTPQEKQALPTHRGWDQGALTVALHLQKHLHSPLFAAMTSRLLVDLNRSAHHPSCLGASFRGLDAAAKESLLETYYHPYREAVEACIRQLLLARDTAVFHLAVHSFTPELAGEVRTADLAWLYDPARASERKWADVLVPSFRQSLPTLRTRRNYPYQGKSDGFTRYLRQTFPVSRYAGFELEINQSLLSTVRSQTALAKALLPLLSPLFAPLSSGTIALFPSA